MARSRTVPVDREIAGLAAGFQLHATDARIAATTRREDATLVPFDSHLSSFLEARRP